MERDDANHDKRKQKVRRKRREELRNLVDAARRKRGVREMDMFRDPA